MDPRDRVTIEDLLKRKRSFFIRYKTNVDMWDAEDFDPQVDFFDLEDMLASRYWLKRLEREGKLTAEELRELHNLEKRFHELGIPEFVKEHFPGVYEKWIEEERKESKPAVIVSDLVDSEAILEALAAEKGWTGIEVTVGGKNEDKAIQTTAA